MVSLTSNEYCRVSPNIDTSKTDYFNYRDLQPHNWAWIVCGIAAILACLLSFYLMWRHLSHYTKSSQQKHIVRIILMVPIYAIDSFFSFRFYWLAVYFDVVRDCYEAFVIYTFYSLLLEYLGGYQHGKELIAQKGKIHLVIPLCFVEVEPKRGLLRQCKRLTLQYVVIRPLMTLLTIILQSANAYCPGNYSPAHGYVYVTFVNFLSVTLAMYALVQFYSIIREYIAQYKPIPKFLSVKFVIFLSFWQSIIVSGIVDLHGITGTTYWSTANIATGVQDGLTCIEMLIAAIAHIYVYDWKEFDLGDTTTTNIFYSAANAFNPVDIAHDIYHSFFPASVRFPQKGKLAENEIDEKLESKGLTEGKADDQKGGGGGAVETPEDDKRNIKLAISGEVPV